MTSSERQPFGGPGGARGALDAADFDVFFNLGVAVARADVATCRLLRVNQRMSELTGFSMEELCSMTFCELTHPDDREADLARFSAMVKGELAGYRTEKRYIRKDGTIAWVQVTANVVRDASGTPIRTVAVVQDISEERRSRHALRESEAQMRSLLDSTAEGIWGIDLEGRCTFANTACLRLLGYGAPEELVGRNMHLLTHYARPNGAPYPEHECRIHQAFRARDPADVEDEVFFRKDGSSFPVHYRSSPVLQDGRITGAVVTFKDATEHTRAEQERAQTLALLRTLAEHAADALYVMDSEGRTRFMNPAATRMFGWTPEETLGVVLHDLVHSRHPDGRPFPIQECPLGAVMMNGAAVLDHHDEFIHKDGRFVPVACSNAPVITDGVITGAVLVVHDLSERERTAYEARKRAEFEQQLIGIVSHDLRNPISAMLLAAQVVRRRPDVPPDALRTVDRIVSSGERALRLIRDLLDFTQARLGAGIPVERRPADLHRIARQVVEEVQQAYPDRILVFDAEGDGQGNWDADRVSQIATNLAVNAVAYSAAGTPVKIRTRDDGQWVVLEVHNEGAPIPAEMIPQLFEPLRRGAERRETENIGLGLFIVNQLVRAHAGKIDVRSTAAGTTFTVRLPRHGPEAAHV